MKGGHRGCEQLGVRVPEQLAGRRIRVADAIDRRIQDQDRVGCEREEILEEGLWIDRGRPLCRHQVGQGGAVLENPSSRG